MFPREDLNPHKQIQRESPLVSLRLIKAYYALKLGFIQEIA